MVNAEVMKGIKISEIVSEEVADKVDVLPIQKILDTIDLSKYGTGIKSIHMMVVVVPPENKLHENRAEFNPEEKSIILELNLSYPHVLKASKSEVTKMTAQLFLVSIDLYEKWRIGDFNLLTFKNEVESTFHRNELL